MNQKEYENPDFNKDLCRHVQTPYLLYMTVDECDYARRMLVSVIFGAIIGLERRAADRPAGIRTMSLVSLGSCFFTMCGMNAFRSSTMGWDAARVSAAIPSGVGFLGAGLIWKGTVPVGPDERHQVHGLATAAGVWLSAAIGVGVGGRLYIPSAYAVVLVIFLLRLGPLLVFEGNSDATETFWSEGDWDTDDDKEDAYSDYESDDYNNDGDDDDQKNVVTQDEFQYLLEQEGTSDIEMRDAFLQKFRTMNSQRSMRSVRSIKSTKESQSNDTKNLKVDLNNNMSSHSLPMEKTVHFNDDSSYNGIDGKRFFEIEGMRRVVSQPNLIISDTRTSPSEGEGRRSRMRKVKSEAEFFVPLSRKRSKSRPRRHRSKTPRKIKRPNPNQEPIFID